MVLDNINSFDRVLVATLDGLDGVHYHLGVEVVFRPNDLGTHGGLGAIQQGVLAQIRHLDGQVLGNVVAGLTTGNFVPTHDGSGM